MNEFSCLCKWSELSFLVSNPTSTKPVTHSLPFFFVQFCLVSVVHLQVSFPICSTFSIPSHFGVLENVHSPLHPQRVGISLKAKYPSNLFLKSILRASVNYEVENSSCICCKCIQVQPVAGIVISFNPERISCKI